MDKFGAIAPKLQRLRRAAKALSTAGFEQEALELMRISRGEVRLKSGGTLFDMSPVELDNARACVTWERLRWAASSVLQRKQIEHEDENFGGQGWPKDRRKSDVITEVAKEQAVSESSLHRFMADKDCPKVPSNGLEGILILGIHPDWHPDIDKDLFSKG